MFDSITRRMFFQRLIRGAASSWAVLPLLDAAHDGLLSQLARAGDQGAGTNSGHWAASVDGGGPSASDDAIPTRLFFAGYTQSDLERAISQGQLSVGFPWGVADVHSLGGIAQRSNIAIGADGSAVLTLRRPYTEELRRWQEDAGIASLIATGEQNGLVMKLSAAVISGRVPTDARSLQVSITLPDSIRTMNRSAGMSGIGWTFWTIVDVERLASALTNLDVSQDEIDSFISRLNLGALEEDIAEMSLGEPTVELGYPLWVRLLSNTVLTFMAGRKTMTAKSRRIDLLQTLFEPIGVGPLPIVNDRTISGWLASGTVSQDQVLRQPLRARIDIGSLIYDVSRDVMVAPLSFSLNGKRLSPTKTTNFPGLENDPTGSTTANLSIWQIKTSKGQWVTVPRRFILNLNSSTGHQVTGDRDSVSFSDLVITRGK